MEHTFPIVRDDGTVRELRLTNARERTAIHTSLVKTYERHLGLFPGEFDPPTREQAYYLTDLRRNLDNLIVFRNYLKHHGHIPLVTLDSALAHYQRWLGQGEEGQSEEDADTTSFFDANHSLVDKGAGAQSRPTTPLVGDQPSVWLEHDALQGGEVSTMPTGAEQEGISLLAPPHVLPGELPPGDPSLEELTLRLPKRQASGPTVEQPPDKRTLGPGASLSQRFRNFAKGLANPAGLPRTKSTQSEPCDATATDGVAIFGGAIPSGEEGIPPTSGAASPRIPTQMGVAHLDRSTIFSPKLRGNLLHDLDAESWGGLALAGVGEQAQTYKPKEQHGGPPRQSIPVAWTPSKRNHSKHGPAAGTLERAVNEAIGRRGPPGPPTNWNSENPPMQIPHRGARVSGEMQHPGNSYYHPRHPYTEPFIKIIGEATGRKETPGPPPPRNLEGPPLVERSRGGARVSDLSLEELAAFIRSVVVSSEPSRDVSPDRWHQDSRERSGHEWQYDYAPRSRFHLVDLDKFSGDVETYPVFKQNLLLCLDRTRLRDEKDKALFVYKYLTGTPKELVTHLIRPLTEESYSSLIRKLDKAYGRNQDLDRILIRKIYKLPRLTELNLDNLLLMSSVLEAAMPALMRKEPVDTLSTNGDKLNWVVNLLPQVDRDLFRIHCRMTNQCPNLKGFLHYLDEKHEERISMLPMRPERSHRGTLPQKLQKEQRHHSKPAYLTRTQEGDSGTDGPSSEEESPSRTDPGLALKVENEAASPHRKFGPCKCCEGPHSLGYCDKFKTLTLEKRRRIVDQAKACSSCLAVGHFARDCRRRKNCPKTGCDMRHHHLLHDDHIAKVKFFEETGDGYEYLTDPEAEVQRTPPAGNL